MTLSDWLFCQRLLACYLNSLQQHINRSRAAVHLSRRDEGKNILPSSEPGVHSTLQHGSALSRTEPLAMHDTNAEPILLRVVLNEVSEPRLCLRQRHAVQVNLSLHAVTTPGQFSHCSAAHMLSIKAQCSPMAVFDRVDIVLEAFEKDGFFIRPRKPRPGFGLYFVLRNAFISVQSLRSRHGAEKCFFVVVSHGA